MSSEPQSSRTLLLKAITSALQSWPELHRRVFIQTHYEGKSVQEISQANGIETIEVRQILESSEHRLRDALREFRRSSESTKLESTLQTI